MNGTKKGTVLLIAALVLALLCACGGSAKEVPVSDIVTAVDGVLGGGENFTQADAGVVEGYMKLSPDDYADCAVKINSYGTSFDEYGVFQAADSSQAKTIAGALEAYLQLKLDTDMGYQPEELPKLEKAEVKTSGNYVMYCVLGDTEKSAAFGAFEEALK